MKIRAIASVDTKWCKMEKEINFTHFEQKKNTHISGCNECKLVHKCTIAIVTVHICTVIVAFAFNILLFFLSPPHSLLFSLVWLSPHALFSSIDLRRSLKSHHSHAPADHLTRHCSRWSPLPHSPFRFPLFPNGHNNSVKNKKTNIQPPT